MLECLPEMISGWENELVCITFLKGARVCVVGFFLMLVHSIDWMAVRQFEIRVSFKPFLLGKYSGLFFYFFSL